MPKATSQGVGAGVGTGGPEGSASSVPSYLHWGRDSERGQEGSAWVGLLLRQKPFLVGVAGY